MHFEDLTGQEFGKLTAIKRLYADKYRASIWECICECGASTKVRSNSLKSGHTKSCGNRFCENANAYYEKDGYMVGTLARGGEFYFDKEDMEIVKNSKWYEASNCIMDCTSQRLSRVIMRCGKGVVVDHISGDYLDNRKSNLRICTQRQNVFNQRKRTAKTSSQYKGVSLDKRSGKYVAYISRDRKRYQIGLFVNEIAAAIAYNTKANQLFGEYARLNLI